MGDERDENPTVNSTPWGLKCSAGHNHDDDLGSVALVGVVGVSNASSLGRLSLVKSSFALEHTAWFDEVLKVALSNFTDGAALPSLDSGNMEAP